MTAADDAKAISAPCPTCGVQPVRMTCGHSVYWRTIYDGCMACRAEAAEAALARTRVLLRDAEDQCSALMVEKASETLPHDHAEALPLRRVLEISREVNDEFPEDACRQEIANQAGEIADLRAALARVTAELEQSRRAFAAQMNDARLLAQERDEARAAGKTLAEANRRHFDEAVQANAEKDAALAKLAEAEKRIERDHQSWLTLEDIKNQHRDRADAATARADRLAARLKELGHDE